jgi:hypothetical protein
MLEFFHIAQLTCLNPSLFDVAMWKILNMCLLRGDKLSQYIQDLMKFKITEYRKSANIERQQAFETATINGCHFFVASSCFLTRYIDCNAAAALLWCSIAWYVKKIIPLMIFCPLFREKESLENRAKNT